MLLSLLQILMRLKERHFIQLEYEEKTHEDAYYYFSRLLPGETGSFETDATCIYLGLNGLH